MQHHQLRNGGEPTHQTWARSVSCRWLETCCSALDSDLSVKGCCLQVSAGSPCLPHAKRTTRLGCCQCVSAAPARCLQANQVGHLVCSCCRITLMYAHGAASVKCAVCNTVTPVSEEGGAQGSRQQGGPQTTGHKPNKTVVIVNPSAVDEDGNEVGYMPELHGCTPWKLIAALLLARCMCCRGETQNLLHQGCAGCVSLVNNSRCTVHRADCQVLLPGACCSVVSLSLGNQ